MTCGLAEAVGLVGHGSVEQQGVGFLGNASTRGEPAVGQLGLECWEVGIGVA
jgi:hypothetical protein